MERVLGIKRIDFVAGWIRNLTAKDWRKLGTVGSNSERVKSTFLRKPVRSWEGNRCYVEASGPSLVALKAAIVHVEGKTQILQRSPWEPLTTMATAPKWQLSSVSAPARATGAGGKGTQGGNPST